MSFGDAVEISLNPIAQETNKQTYSGGRAGCQMIEMFEVQIPLHHSLLCSQRGMAAAMNVCERVNEGLCKVLLCTVKVLEKC